MHKTKLGDKSFKSRESPLQDSSIDNMNLRLKRSCRTEDVSVVAEKYQDVVVIQESSSSWSNEEEKDEDPVSTRQLEKIEKMNKTLTNTL
jgi:23S rRNA G2069 N7-methylase RlmK/C1962 C5-methylase RlmI